MCVDFYWLQTRQCHANKQIVTGTMQLSREPRNCHANEIAALVVCIYVKYCVFILPGYEGGPIPLNFFFFFFGE